MRDDPTRLDELRRLLILDSAPERDFDAVTQLLADTLQVPIAIVNLLDEKRDWFKACIGLPMTESPAATSFCEAFFGSGDDLIEVADTALDPRFEAHPLVIGPPFVRFYAAARLSVNGQTVGTLCAYDCVPRQLPSESLAQLRLLANSVVELLRMRSATKPLV